MLSLIREEFAPEKVSKEEQKANLLPPSKVLWEAPWASWEEARALLTIYVVEGA